MEVPLLIQWGVPAGAIVFGLVSYAWAWYAGREFDRRYGKRG